MGLPPVPRRIHQVWIGPEPVPADWTATWAAKNPGFEYRLWREADLDQLDWNARVREVYDRYVAEKVWCGAVNVARAVILSSLGGVYVDADMNCLTTIERAPFMHKSLWVSMSPHSRVRTQNGAMGCCKGHPLMRQYVRALGKVSVLHPSWQCTGSVLFDAVRKKNPRLECYLVPSPAFHPHTKLGQPNPMLRNYPGKIYADHHFYTTHQRASGKMPRPVK